MNGVKYRIRRTNERKSLRNMKFNERVYKNNFFFFEFGFIFVIIPLLVISFVSVPFLTYVALTGNVPIWPIIIVAIIIIFSQIMAIQYLVRRFYLEPHNMTFGEYLRYLFDKRIDKMKMGDFAEEKNIAWYDELDPFIEKIRNEMREQTEKIYSSVYDSYQIE